jgi:hypothetical protein
MSNDVNSLLLASTILGIGGLGLYLYGSSFEKQNDESDSESNENEVNDELNETIEEIEYKNENRHIKSKGNKNLKTKKNKKKLYSGTKRRY